MTTFKNAKHVYFIGIGGVSMSGLAEMLTDRGFRVSGTDIKESPVTKHLESLGIHINYGHRKENITDDVDLVVYTAAIHPDNHKPENDVLLKNAIVEIDGAETLFQKHPEARQIAENSGCDTELYK